MGLTQSNSGLFSAPSFIVSPVGKRERRKKILKKEKGRREKGSRKGMEGRKEGRKEGRRNKNDRRNDKEF